ncbi:4-alpha-glucanotransferase [Actinomadura kijaniata]|uniref:4-alpha-glucanotransferase n=1 Tax=Actinomadura kijaniata TaxID=46161 RepID=UPI003F1AC3EB
MLDDELNRLARAHRVATRYTDWRGREATVPADTLRAVLTSLGADVSTPAAVRDELARLAETERVRLLPPVVTHRMGARAEPLRIPVRAAGRTEVAVELADGRVLTPSPGAPADGVLPCALPEGIPLGWHRLVVRQGPLEQSAPLLVAPARLAPVPRAWGLTTQLYSVRSRASWGIGDLRDLADLATWGGRAMGAGFVLVNPLHAAEPSPPITPSPYSPASRRFGAPLYLRVEDVPEYAALPPEDRERVDLLANPLRGRDETLDVLDRDAVWTAKRHALELLYRWPRGTARQRAFERFREHEGEALTAFATWCAIGEEQGPDWRRWPEELRDARGPAVAAAAKRLAERVDFHAWLQWQLDEQLTAAQSAARAAGMHIGIVHDLAVGVAHGSADVWMNRPLFAEGISVGAPPDEFNQLGQDWGQPPWHPGRLAEAAYLPYREMLNAALRHGGGLRLDHAMQVSRLWWIPEGGSPAEGTYVRYDRDVLLSCLTWEAARTGAVVVGEDLGTVEAEVREDLAARGVLGTSLLWFERDEEGRPKPPSRWRELSLATVGTHDMPPITGFLHGDHIELRDRLGLYTRTLDEELADHRRQLGEWLDLLHEEGLLATPPKTVLAALRRGQTDHDAEVTAALHAFLLRTPARLVGVSLADAAGERRTQNQPGTVDEYPNWRIPLADAEGRPLPLDDLFTDPRVRDALEPVSRAPW